MSDHPDPIALSPGEQTFALVVCILFIVTIIACLIVVGEHP